MITRTQHILNHLKGPTILDIGCAGQALTPGSPNWLHGAIQSRFPDTYGIDINSESIDELINLGYKNIYVASAETFKLEKDFDTIVAGELIEHLENPGLFLDNAKNHLKKEGQLLITTPYPFSLMNILYAFYKYPETSSNPEHTCWFCPSNIYSLADRTGYTIDRIELIEDYDPTKSSRIYRIFIRFIQVFRWLIPDRLKNNTMLILMKPK